MIETRVSRGARSRIRSRHGGVGWSPALDSEAGGMYFRRERRILEGEGTGGDASESTVYEDGKISLET